MTKHTLHVEGVGNLSLDIEPATGGQGYSIVHTLADRVSISCSCANGTSVSTTCPTASFQCNCLPNASITCD